MRRIAFLRQIGILRQRQLFRLRQFQFFPVQNRHDLFRPALIRGIFPNGKDIHRQKMRSVETHFRIPVGSETEIAPVDHPVQVKRIRAARVFLPLDGDIDCRGIIIDLFPVNRLVRKQPAHPEGRFQQMINRPARGNRGADDLHGPRIGKIDREGIFGFERHIADFEHDLIAALCRGRQIELDTAFPRFPDQKTLSFRYAAVFDDRGLRFSVLDQNEIIGISTRTAAAKDQQKTA